MSTGFAYDYDELINKSEEISFFANNFDKHLKNLEEFAKIINRNISSEQAKEIITNLARINSKSGEIQKALVNFSISIRDEIAPEYERIQKNARDKVESIYG